ncbi:hypothetical protein LARI1_G007834 [Lachnellula arida]|uniref:Aminoglycoside phosphotransferase domain-containing protein n=1 Tax=Lachnellula arida TaxID=1316785 RepID=A0A8T9B7Z3_9HELO|nr:hypothetical protein LARI1_G007834 [Lachnellula arida]
MSYLKAKFSRKGKSKEAEPLPSTVVAAIKTDQELSPDGPSLSHYASPTIKAPEISHEHRNNWLLRKYVLGLVWITRPIDCTTRNTRALRIWLPVRVVIKHGTEIQLAEASTLRFLRNKTSIPVPKVYCAFQLGKTKYIMMQHVRGKHIKEGWADRSAAEKEKLLQQLKGYFDELRSIPHPQPGAVSSAHIGPLFDRRIDEEDRGFGPFANEEDFNNFLRCGVGQDGEPGQEADSWFNEEAKSEIKTLIATQNQNSHQICFTHGDANSANILVRGNKVVALIDFEMAGFYPEYWEYTTAMTTAVNLEVYDDSLWKEEIGKFLEEYPEELEMERLRQKLFGVDGFRQETVRI